MADKPKQNRPRELSMDDLEKAAGAATSTTTSSGIRDGTSNIKDGTSNT